MSQSPSDLAEGAARRLRLGLEADGWKALAAFVDALSAALPGLDPTFVEGRLAPLLGEALAGQERHDSLWVADLLEHELAPLLRSAGA